MWRDWTNQDLRRYANSSRSEPDSGGLLSPSAAAAHTAPCWSGWPSGAGAGARNRGCASG